MDARLAELMPHPGAGARFLIETEDTHLGRWLKIEYQTLEPSRFPGIGPKWKTQVTEKAIPAYANRYQSLEHYIAKEARDAMEAYIAGKGLERFSGIYG